MAEIDTFSDLANVLDSRILTALSKLGFVKPTLVQATAIPLALHGRDIACRAKTGSGKTLAYGIPIIHNLLQAKESLESSDPALHSTRVLVLVPTRELSNQVTNHLRDLCSGLGESSEIKVCNIAYADSSRSKGKSAAKADKVHQIQLLEKPDIVISTPSRALHYLRGGFLSLKYLESLSIDEADLIFSYGHSSDDILSILSGSWELPAVYQSYLMSATMTDDVDLLKGIVLRKPAILRLEDDPNEMNDLSQFYSLTSEEDKFLLLYVLLKLKLIKGKALIFVNETDRSYKVKLFLEKFGIRAGVLNSDLPFNSRYHAVQEFNRGAFDYLIATDRSEEAEEIPKDENDKPSNLIPVQKDDEVPDSKQKEHSKTAGKKRKRLDEQASKRTEYGVSRGIDFIDVACVINFDLPVSVKSYTHRVGRTARAGRSGMSLSFVVPKERWGKLHGQAIISGKKKNQAAAPLPESKYDEMVWKRIRNYQEDRGSEVTEYKFDMKQVEGFRYRMEDALKAVTSAAIREARLKELKGELINSEKLKAHFEDNPTDLDFLRHDRPSQPARVQSHLKHVPSYLMPRITSHQSREDQSSPLGQPNGNPRFLKHSRGGKSQRGSSRRGGTRGRKDPLRTFKK